MKIIKLFPFALICSSLFSACDASKQQASSDSLLNKEISFSATFFTVRDYSVTPECNPDFPDYDQPNYQSAENAGTGTLLGSFNTTMSFCTGTPSPEGTPYGGGHGKFIAEDGDELYFSMKHGKVLPIADPQGVHDLYFKDPFYFTGGTGRFSNASGEGMTNSLVNLFDDNGEFIAEHRTDHVWTGMLILD